MSHVVLIGPIGVGKSTTAPPVATGLGCDLIDVDRVRWDYYTKAGFNGEWAQSILHAEGFEALCEYWKPFEIDVIERNCGGRTDSVVDCGAGHAHYDGHDHFLGRAERSHRTT